MGNEVSLVCDNTDSLYVNYKEYILGNKKLSDDDREKLGRVKKIPERFLCAETYGDVRLAKVEAIDLAVFKSVESIGFDFCFGLKNLKQIDLSPLFRLTETPVNFLNTCSSLKSLDLSPLKNVHIIHHYFLYGCSNLTQISLEPFKNVTLVHPGFLGSCTGLGFVDIGALGSSSTRLKIDAENFMMGTDLNNKVKLLHADSLDDAKVEIAGHTNEANWLRDTIKHQVKLREKREMMLRTVGLVAHKGNSKMTKMLKENWAPRKLVLLFMLPGMEKAPVYDAPGPEDGELRVVLE